VVDFQSGNCPYWGDRRLAGPQLAQPAPDLLHVLGSGNSPPAVARLLEQELPVLIRSPRAFALCWALAGSLKEIGGWHSGKADLEQGRCLAWRSAPEGPAQIRALGFRGRFGILPNCHPSIDRSAASTPPGAERVCLSVSGLLLFLRAACTQESVGARCWGRP